MDSIPNKISHSNALTDLVSELGIDTLPKEKQDDIMVKMTEILLKKVFLETMEKLDMESREEYEKMVERENVSPEELEKFFRNKITNYDEMVLGVIDQFKKEMKEMEEEGKI